MFLTFCGLLGTSAHSFILSAFALSFLGLTACQLNVEFEEPTYTATIEMIKSRAKADGQDQVRFDVTVINQKLKRPAENINVSILVNGEEPQSHDISCTKTNRDGKASCVATSATWSLIYLEVDLGEKILANAAMSLSEEDLVETPERKKALFYDIYSYMQETTPGSGTAFADTLLSSASVSIYFLDSQNQPIEGMNPLIKVDGGGATSYQCSPSDISGEAICLVYAETPGVYQLISETPRLADPLTLTFLSRTRSCNILPNAHAYEVWGEGGSPTWGACSVSGCFTNYSMSPSGDCLPDTRACVPFPVGASNATQLWEELAPGAWGPCVITACSLNYTLSGAGAGNSCIANTRNVDVADLPPNAETAEETWNGTDWDPPYATSCRYPYKAVGGICVPLDIFPDAFVILNKVYQNLGEVVYSTAVTVSGIETVVMASLAGDPSAFIEKKPLGGNDWIPFNTNTDTLSNGDEFRLGVISSTQIDVTSTVTYSIGAAGPLNWSVTTRDSNPPGEFQVNHANNEKEFSLGWNLAGMANSPRTCGIEIQKDAATWTSVASGLDCDSILPLTTFSLPSVSDFSSFFDSNGISLRVRRSDGIVLANLNQKLRCIPDPFIPYTDNPDRDENCNGNWADDSDTHAPVGGFFSIAEEPLTTSPLITLNIVCPTDLEGSTVQVAYSETNPPSDWESCSSTKPLILSGDGLRTVYVRFKDGNNNMTSVDSATITYDSSQAVADGSFVINGGQPYTRQIASVLSIFCPTEIDGAAPSFSVGPATDPGDPLEPGDWTACVNSLPYNLSAGDGVKNVYMRFKGDLGTVTASTSSSIILDETNPIVSISYFDGWRTDTNISVNVSASDALSGVDYCELQISQAPLSNGVVGAFSGWSTLGTSCTPYNTQGVSGTAYRFRIRAADRAGNLTSWFAPSAVLKLNAEEPYGGSISYSTGIQTTTSILVNVDRGLDPYSGMSASAADYLLEVSWASLNTSTLSCGVFGAFVDAGVVESPMATQYTYSGTQGRCYKLRYSVKNALGASAVYVSDSITKINYTYSWNIGSYGACVGGTGTWDYGSWGACTGGTGMWVYSSWSSCSVSCGGGTQTRTASCQINPNTASEVRSATCNKVALSGLQTRTVFCQRSDGTSVDDSYCSGSKPVTQQSCTPTSNSVCGSSVTSRSCTNTSISVCGTRAPLQQSCNTQQCCNSTGTRDLCPGTIYTLCGDANDGCSQIAGWKCKSGSASRVSLGVSCDEAIYRTRRLTCRCN